MNLRLLILALLWVPSLLACWGGGARTYNTTKTTTLGQELTDLQAAKERGAISEVEFQKQKEKLLGH